MPLHKYLLLELLLLGVLLASSCSAFASDDVPDPESISVNGKGFIEAFELKDVTLHDDSFQAKAAKMNTEYLLKLDANRLLWVFRDNAKLPTPGIPFIGTWESPGCELRGHFVGHYLTAISMVVMSTGDSAAKARLGYLVDELAKVQDALGEGGYLSAFPSEHFDRQETPQGVWAPYYVIHKIMAGLLDAYTMTGNTKAMSIVNGMADYHYKRITKVITEKGMGHWQECLNIEFGGMNDVMYRMFAATRNETHLQMAQYFDKVNFFEPLADNKDVLQGMHANTHLAQVVGFAEAYEVKKEQKMLDVVRNFFSMVTTKHSYATGGSNDKEFWYQANMLAESILDAKDSLETQEICTQYNILKIARSLFRWSGDIRLADFYERALVNGILGTSRLTNDDVQAGHHPHHHHEHGPNDGHHHHYELSVGSDHLALASSASLNHHHRSKSSMEAELTNLAELQKAWGREAVEDMSGSHYANTSAALKHRREFVTRSQDYWGYQVAKMPNNENATNVAGTPGVYLYLLTLGAGRSKADNYHHWGYPEHSFWCCYGTAIEAFAKLADSIYFKTPQKAESNSILGCPRLYVNQYVSSSLNWHEMGVKVVTKAYGFEPGPSVRVTMNFTVNKPPPVAGNNDKPSADPGVKFNLLLRIPTWALTGMTVVRINGQEWVRCPSAPSPGTYCNVLRSWESGDSLTIDMSLAYWIKPLPDSRPQYQDLKAFMMGPHVMAGLTHDTQYIQLQGDLEDSFSEPADEDELLSIQAAWNSSLYLRHDMYHVYMSAIEDSGDAIDATFRLASSCEEGKRGAMGLVEPDMDPELSRRRKQAVALGLTTRRLMASDGGSKDDDHLVGERDKLHHMRQQMKVGLHDDLAVLLESMNFPGFYIGSKPHDDFATISQPATPRDDASSTDYDADYDYEDEAVHTSSTHSNTENDGFCSFHQFMLRPGLDGRTGTISLESVARPSYFLSAFDNGAAQRECKDHDSAECDHAASTGLCISQPELYKTKCRKSCQTCGLVNEAVTLQKLVADNKDFAAVSSFRLATALTPRYPPGSKVLAGKHRRYLAAPLGNLVDERYTVYFKVEGRFPTGQ